MKLSGVTTALTASLAIKVLAFDPPHPCYFYAVKVPKLMACPTGKAFCSYYLNSPDPFTRTSTRTKVVAQSTTTSFSTATTTTTVYLATQIVTPTTVTVMSTSTTTTTTMQDSCPSDDVALTARAAATTAAASSCGIASNANTSEVSGACDCILASRTVVITTQTSGGMGTTTIISTTTTTSTADLISISTAIATVTSITTATVTTCTTLPVQTGNAYCENGQPVNGLTAPCTEVGCSTTNLRIEGTYGTIYEGTILAGPANITTASGGTHLCDGTNNGANPSPFDNGITTIAAAGGLCNFGFDGTFSSQFDDFFIQTIGDTAETGDDFWGILLNYEFTPAGGCETEVHPTDELLWAFNAFNVNYFLRVEPTQTPIVLAPGQSTTFTIQGTDGNGDPFVNIAGATFNGQTSDGNGNVPFTAPTTSGTYRYKATRTDCIRSNAVTIVVQG